MTRPTTHRGCNLATKVSASYVLTRFYVNVLLHLQLQGDTIITYQPHIFTQPVPPPPLHSACAPHLFTQPLPPSFRHNCRIMSDMCFGIRTCTYYFPCLCGTFIIHLGSYCMSLTPGCLSVSEMTGTRDLFRRRALVATFISFLSAIHLLHLQVT